MSAEKKGEINIRPMERRDILPALELFKQITEGRSTLTYRDLVNSDLGGSLDLSFVAEIDGEIAGFLLARLVYVGVPLIQMGTVQSVVVDPNYRRQRIAARLIEAMLDRCSNEGVIEVYTTLDERDWELGNFFENLGFHRTKSITYTKTLGT